MGYTKHVLTSGTGYGSANGIRMAFLKHVPVSNGFLPPLIIYHHGIDHRGPRPTSDTDYGTVDIIANKGVPTHINGSGEEIPAKVKPGGDPIWDTRKFAVLAPQCSSEFNTFPFAYCAEMIKYAQANMRGQVDLDNIAVVGYSFGGGLAISCTRDTFINSNISCSIAIAPGYNTNGSTNYPFIADSGLPMYVYTTVTDQFTGILGVADGFVNNVNAANPVAPIQYTRFSGATTGTNNHDDIIITIVKTSADNAAYNLSNGDTWYHSETIYETILRHRKHRRKR